MAASVVMISIAGFTTMVWLGYLTNFFRTAEFDRERVVAFYAAEGGVHQVVNWFNNPAAYTPNSVLFTPFTTTDPTTGYQSTSYFDANNNSRFWAYPDDPNTPEVEGYKVPSSLLRTFTFPGGAELSRIESITISGPPGSTPVFARPICKVTAVGRAMRNTRRTVEMLLFEPIPGNAAAPGAILTGAAATFDANATAHWGQVWAREPITLPANLTQKVLSPKDDPWYFCRTEDVLYYGQVGNYANGASSVGYTATPIAEGASNYFKPYLNAVDRTLRPYENLLQHQTLKWPTYSYDAWKAFTLQRGLPYYRTLAGSNLIFPTDANGDYYRDAGGNVITSTSDPNGPKTYDGLFNNDPSSPTYDDPAKTYAFIDTIDGNPPAPDSSNLADLQVAGQSTHSHGNYFIAADINFTGQGNPANYRAERPDGSFQMLQKLAHNGFLCIWGTANMAGDRVFYGSVYAAKGFSGGGTPDVYYNHKLGDGSFMPIVSRVSTRLWNTY